jgi:hypothetical protein
MARCWIIWSLLAATSCEFILTVRHTCIPIPRFLSTVYSPHRRLSPGHDGAAFRRQSSASVAAVFANSSDTVSTHHHLSVSS